MSLFRNMDAYKAIVLASIILTPVAGFWAWSLQKDIDLARKAANEATRRGGLLEQIGSLMKQRETIRSNTQMQDAVKDHVLYFEKQVYQAARSGISRDDFTIGAASEQGGRQGKQEFLDKEVRIDFGRQGQGRQDFLLTQDFLYAVLYNCESGFSGDNPNPQSIWKLRSLTVVNATDERLLQNHRTPPAELEDKWKVREMKFVRREPKAETRG